MRYFLLITLINFSSDVYSLPDNLYNHLQKFFTTKLVRKKLDLKREQENIKPSSHNKNNLNQPEPISINMQGVVIRKHHFPIVFINDRNTIKSQKISDGITVKIKSNINSDYSVPLLINNKTIKIKPGQHWDEHTQRITKNYKTIVK